MDPPLDVSSPLDGKRDSLSLPPLHSPSLSIQGEGEEEEEESCRNSGDDGTSQSCMLASLRLFNLSRSRVSDHEEKIQNTKGGTPAAPSFRWEVDH